VRVYIAVAMAILVLTIAAQPAMAFTEISIPFITTDCAVFTFPNANTALTILEFNSASTSVISSEKFDMNFPLFADGIVAGPTKVAGASTIDGVSLGAGTSANIIPFGPINLALPSIAQSADEIITCQRTYFFTDTFG
jgi:hypothetical protein